jgi:hypothetical protein
MDWTGAFNLLVRKKKERKMVRINWLVGSSDEIMKIIKDKFLTDQHYDLFSTVFIPSAASTTTALPS